MKKIYLSFVLLTVLFQSCNTTPEETNPLEQLAKEYVKTGLLIGQYDPDFVDAYYGPDNLKPAPAEYDSFPKEMLLHKVIGLQSGFQEFIKNSSDEIEVQRANYILAQLIAAEERIRIVAGETSDFDEESKKLFGVSAPNFEESHFQEIINDLENTLPGSGSLKDRFATLSQQFVIPPARLDTVLRAAIAEARNQTKLHYPIPENESFNLEYVGDKAWSGYNWYKGNYTSLIQINTDFPISIERVIDVGSHESYPGHHVYNMLLEENLYNEKGYIETSLYPLFSPQSLIAEGSANYGIQLAFPEEEKIAFCKETLLPLAGLDTTGITAYFKALESVSKLNYAGNEVARGILNGNMTDDEGIEFLIKYGFYSPDKAKQRIAFTRKYRSYVINYNYGKDLIAQYIDGRADTNEGRWKAFGELLSKQVLPLRLINE
ncbi:hypothetical protein [Jiulongibacter sediminis]|uniref:DUF885 domain-containing protein n=1 Tax=Jiulongibacter sediminis TaxID=1605367 RepID=A0A0P7BXV3_9BACT|nr:hypothetical protein [Jiulongibacter sediminis]KPM49350.1 hypothetical protein AFM12_01640 [Jiulongibacter sediminis]TBX26401.1 hypothetical protein TK44_01645 [Jiulongibacter sediminis]